MSISCRCIRIPEKGLAEHLGDGGPESLDLHLRQIDRDTPFPTGKFVQAIRSKQRHMVRGSFEQIRMLQKHPESYVPGIMRLVRGILIGGLHLGKQVDPLAIRLRLDDLESPGVAQFRDPVQIGAQTLLGKYPRHQPETSAEIRGRPYRPDPADRAKSL